MSTSDTLPGGMDVDPAEFLLSNSKYHDCFLTVGDPVSGNTERIGVSSTHLIANSPVFRKILEENTDHTGANIHITDVSPTTFKQMLRHIYGGNLPELDIEEKKLLGKFGEKYEIYRLVEEVGKQLKLVSREDIFSAIEFSAHVNCPTLEVEVCKIVKELTPALMRENLFLELDEESMLLIVKMDALGVTELELWNHLVRWGENQVKKYPSKTLRESLKKVLGHLRILTLTFDEIVRHVLPTGVLTDEEFIDVTQALAKIVSLECTILCKNEKKRDFYFDSTHTFSSENIPGKNMYLKKIGDKTFSIFTIEPSHPVAIDSFIIKNQACEPNSKYNPVYNLDCSISIIKSEGGIKVERDEVSIVCSAVFFDNITLPIKLKNKKALILDGPGKYTFRLEFTAPHTVYEICDKGHGVLGEMKEANITFEKFIAPSMVVKNEDFPHVIGINYRCASQNCFPYKRR